MKRRNQNTKRFPWYDECNLILGSYDPKDFKLPFADLAGPHPSNEVMRKIAADQNIRPEIPTEWKLNEVRVESCCSQALFLF